MRHEFNPSSVQAERDKLRAECGLNAFAQPPEVWLEIAVAAEARGEHSYAKDCERAAYISNDRWGSTTTSDRTP